MIPFHSVWLRPQSLRQWIFVSSSIIHNEHNEDSTIHLLHLWLFVTRAPFATFHRKALPLSYPSHLQTNWNKGISTPYWFFDTILYPLLTLYWPSSVLCQTKLSSLSSWMFGACFLTNSLTFLMIVLVKYCSCHARKVCLKEIPYC